MKRLAFAGMVMALCAGSASAQSTTVQASLTGYGYQLIDLDPNDGIAPSITFSNYLRGAIATGTAYSGAPTVEDEHYSEDGAPVSAKLGSGSTFASAAFGPQALLANAGIGNAGYYQGIAGWDANFTLSANTKLVYTGHAAAALDTGVANSDRVAVGMISVSFLAPDGWGNGDTTPFLAQYTGLVTADGQRSLDEQFQLEVVNDTGAAISSSMFVTARATAGVLSPVPEPSTWLMLGTGLLLTGAVARGRRARR